MRRLRRFSSIHRADDTNCSSKVRGDGPFDRSGLTVCEDPMTTDRVKELMAERSTWTWNLYVSPVVRGGAVILLTTLVIVLFAGHVPTMQREDVVEGKSAQRTHFSMASLRFMEDEDAVRLFDSVLGKHSSRRPEAARRLAGDSGRHVLERVRLALREDHPVEVKRLLAFILARYGQREGFAWLIHSLAARDMTWELLVEASQVNLDAGMGDAVNAMQWQDWLREQSDADLEDLRLRSVHSLVNHVFDPVRDDYNYAVSLLRRGGSRGECAKVLLRLSAHHPDHEYAGAARELGNVLKMMASEDLAHRHSGRDAKAVESDVFSSLVYRLRDITNDGAVLVSPGGATVLGSRIPGCAESPAQVLVKMGEEVMPRLVGLLSDRRATRIVSPSICGMAVARVLRYQDAAVEILGELMPWRPYVSPSIAIPFSGEPTYVRERVVERVRSWVTETRRQVNEDRLWISVGYASMRDKLRILRDLSVGDRTRPLQVLHQLYRKRVSWRPEICELMCDLADRSCLEEVLTHGEPQPTHEGLRGARGGDWGRYLSACRTVARLRDRYGK